MPTTPGASSQSAPSTPDLDGSSDELETESTTTSTTSWTRALQDTNLDKISPRSKAIRILIGDQMPEGYKLTEIADELGQKPSWVSERLNDLRGELLLQSGRFFPLTDSEFEALTASIERHGVQSPIMIGEHIALVDGRHRLLIAQELGIVDVPAVFLQGLSAEQERELAIALNSARRQLTRNQKRTIVEAELVRDPARSDRLIASIAGVGHPYVASIRASIAESERLMHAAPVEAHSSSDEQESAPAPVATEVARASVEPEQRVDQRGAVRQAPAPRAVPEVPSVEEQQRPLGFVECAHGRRHALYRDGGGYRIEGV